MDFDVEQLLEPVFEKIKRDAISDYSVSYDFENDVQRLIKNSKLSLTFRGSDLKVVITTEKDMEIFVSITSAVRWEIANAGIRELEERFNALSELTKTLEREVRKAKGE